MTKIARIAAVLLCVLMMGMLCAGAAAETSYKSGSYTYVINEDGKTCTITDYTTSTNILTIPASLNGYPVAAIGKDVFRRQTYLRSVTFSGTSLVSIGDSAFYGLTTLESVTFPSSVKTIGASAFSGCTNLKSLTLPSGLESIGSNAFYNCDALTTLTLPKALESLGQYAFYSCGNLTSVTLPTLLTQIGSSTFAYCSSLTSVSFPAALEVVGSSAFSSCSALTELALPDSVTTIDSSAFSSCKGLTSLDLPENLTQIGSSAFSSCTGLTQVSLPDGVTSVGANAFSGCTALESLRLSAGLESFDATCISGCTALSELVIPQENQHLREENGVIFTAEGVLCYYPSDRTDTTYAVPQGTTGIGSGVFKNNAVLTEITLPSTLESIGSEAFYNCSALASIDIPDGVTTIGSSAFYSCDNLASLTLPKSLTQIPSRLANYCPALTQVVIPEGVTSIGANAFSSCTGLVSVVIPDGVTDIGNYAFSACKGLTSLALPAGLKTIGSYAMQSCTKLEELDIPDGVTTIGESAFSGCTSLARIHLPASLTAMSNRMLENCSALTSLTIPDGVPSLEGSYQPAISGCASLTELHLPASLASFDSSAMGSCPKLSTLTLSAENERFRVVDNVLFSAGGALLFYPKGLTAATYDVPAGTTEIGDSVFGGNTSLLKVTLPEGVKVIGDDAFYGCSSLVKITLPEGLTEIGRSAFYQCSSLPLIELPSTLSKLYDNAFAFCTSLERISLPEGITTVEQGLFENCTKLVQVDIPDGVWTIYAYAFRNCASLTEVTVPDTVSTIQSYAFAGCTNLESVSFPSNCMLGDYIFSDCTSLESIPAVNNLSSGMFRNCSSLKTVVLSNKLYSMADAFSGCTALKDVYILNSSLSMPSGTSYFPYSTKIHGHSGSTAQTYAQNKGYSFVVIDEFVIVDGVLHAYNGSGGAVTIPSSVREIGASIFEGNIKVTSVFIPGSVKTIGAYAFYNCDYMTSLQMGYGVETLREECFSSCNNLVDVTLPASIREMEDHIFYSAYSLKELVVPEGITELPESFLSHAESLESITLPSTLKTIRDCAFNSCYALRTLTVPAGVEQLVGDVFYLCSALETLYLPDGIITIGSRAFEYTPETLKIYCSAGSSTAAALGTRGHCDPAYPGLKLVSKADGITATVLDASCEGYVLPEGTAALGDGLFAGCESLRYVVLPASVQAISETAFDALPDAIYAPAGSFAADWAAANGVFTFDPADSPAVVPLAQEITLAAGDTLDAAALFRAEAGYALENGEMTFALEDPSVAAIDGSTITAMGRGDTALTAALVSDPSVSAQITLRVRDKVESIILGDGLTVASGARVPLEIISVTPEGAQDDLVWSLGDPAAAVIDGSTLTATALSDIETTITVTAWNGVSASMPLHVYLPEIASVAFEGEMAECEPGAVIALNCAVTDQHTVWTNQLAAFSSSDDAVASVDENGVVSVLARGLAVITAQAANGMSDTFTIDSRLDIAKAQIVPDVESFTYNGEEHRLMPVIRMGEETLAADEAYTLSYEGDTVNAGTVTVTAAGVGNYKGKLTLSYQILPADIALAQVTLEQTQYVYDGTQKTPAVSVVMGQTQLAEGADYSVAYAANLNKGTATVTITGVGNYTGLAEAAFEILPMDISNAVVTIEKTSYTYTDGAILPTVTSVSIDGLSLTRYHYTLSGENNVLPGDATLILTGTGNYTGSVSVPFTITSVRRAALPDESRVAEWAPYADARLHEGENHVFLTQNLTSSISVGSGMTVYLDLNGFTISARNAISVSGGGRLVLCDYAGGGKITCESWSTSGCGLLLYENARADMYGGTITGYAATETWGYMGGVYLNKNAEFNMHGGTITGNKAYSGGGISSNYGNVSIYGGTISGNRADYQGGGIYIYRGNLAIYGGRITGNTSYSDGGGVYFGKGYRSDPYTFTMNGGEISANTTTYAGGAGVYVYYSDMTLSGGTITGNTLTGQNGKGAGLGGSNAGVLIKGNPVITGNKNASGAADNLRNAFITIDGGFFGSIGVGADVPGDGVSAAVIAKADGALSESDLACFTPDNSEHAFYLLEDGRAVLGQKTYFLRLTNARTQDGAAYAYLAPGEKATVTAVVPEGKIFTGWQYSDGLAAEEAGTTLTVTMPMASASISALLVDEFVVSGGMLTAYNGEDKPVITLPEGVTAIAEGVFDGCAQLDMLILGASAKDAFTGALPESVIALFAQDGVLFGCAGVREDIVLPEDIVCIDYCAFPEGVVSVTGPAVTSAWFDPCTTIARVSFPAMETVVDYAFSVLEGLTEAHLPAAQRIGDGAFMDCAQLERIDLPAAQCIGNSAFASCAGLKEISMPCVTEIGNGAFVSSGLEQITLDGVVSIGARAFARCEGMTQVFIPDTVTAIGASAFEQTVLIRSSVGAYARTWAQENGCAWEHDVHTETILPALEATCTIDGLTQGLWCPVCEKVFTAQEIIPAAGHQEAIDAAVEATCTTDGLTQGIHCETCGEVLIAQEVIPAAGHAQAAIDGFAPTCTEPGLTDEIFCETCGETLQAAEEIPAAGHVQAVIDGFAPTCTEPGVTDEIFCETCGETLQAAEEIPAAGHSDTVTKEAIEPTCTTSGCTAEHACAVCGEVLCASEILPATGHSEVVSAPAVEPGCVSGGWTQEISCCVCLDVLTPAQEIPATGHAPVTDAGYAQTDRENGLTEGSHCETCGEILIAQEVIPANFTFDGDMVVAYNAKDPVVVIPSDASALGNTVFKNNTIVTSVTVPQSVKSLGTQTFYGCTALEDVYLPDDLTGIGAQTFYKVSARIHTGAGGTAAVALSYRSVPFTTPEGFILRYRVTTATGTPTATWIVGYCGEETTLRIPESFAGAGVTQILSGAFAAVTTLESVTIPACVTSIAADAFDGLSDTLLIRSAMDAPAKQWALDNGFAWEHDHTTDLLAAVEPTCTQNGLTQGQWCAGCGLIYAAQEVIPATGHTEVIHPAVPATHVTTGLTQGVSCSVCGEAIVRQEIIPEADVPVVTLPAALRAIETQAFANCPFVCVVLPQGCERIEARAFENSAQLRFVEIPASAARIADDAFAGCADLIIVTEEGSAAQAYAAEHGVRCVIR